MFFLRACLGAVWARSALPGFVVVRGGFRSAFGRQILRRSAAGLLSFRFRLSIACRVASVRSGCGSAFIRSDLALFPFCFRGCF